MPKVKVPRKSTSVDMTAMCDVAFLLLSFFILTTKFKSDDGLGVVTPNSVSTKPAADKNVVMVTMDKDGKAYNIYCSSPTKVNVYRSLMTIAQNMERV